MALIFVIDGNDAFRTMLAKSIGQKIPHQRVIGANSSISMLDNIRLCGGVSGIDLVIIGGELASHETWRNAVRELTSLGYNRPIIGCTGDVDRESEMTAVLGQDNVFPKPLPPEFWTRLREHISK